jgi:putative transposase
MTTTDQILCKYCDSENVVKFGTYKGVQRYYCKECQRKFVSTDTIPKMQYSTSKVADALNMYYEGMSLNEIRRNFIQQHNDYPSDVSVLNWVNRFTKLAVIEADKTRPDVGGVWVADETVVDIDGKNVWFWDIIDSKTRFLIASHMSLTRTSKDAEELMKQAYNRAGKMPRVIYTDKLRAYLEGIERTFGADVLHKQGSPFDVESNTNYIERFHGTLKERTKVMRGLHTLQTARLFLDGWLVHYNFFRPHMSLNDSTPAACAGVKFPFRNWKDITEQPYEKTARIPMPEKKPIPIPKEDEVILRELASSESRPKRRIVKKQPKRKSRTPRATRPTVVSMRPIRL